MEIRPEIREQKITDFINTQWGGRRWCTSSACGCLGCINRSLTHRWKQMYPDESPITKEEFDLNVKTLKEDEPTN